MQKRTVLETDDPENDHPGACEPKSELRL
jgi:hypothetical protein